MTQKTRDLVANPQRRRLLQTTAAAASLDAVRAAFPGGVWAATADAPETKTANLGFIALTDAGVLQIFTATIELAIK